MYKILFSILFIIISNRDETFFSKENIYIQDCKIRFKEFGIKDFVLGETKTSVLKNMTKVKQITNKNYSNTEFYMFEERIKIFDSYQSIRYNLAFENDLLSSYFFDISSDKDIYKSFITQTKKYGFNDFIGNSVKIQYMYSGGNSDCYKYIKLLKNHKNEIYIRAGIKKVK